MFSLLSKVVRNQGMALYEEIRRDDVFDTNLQLKKGFRVQHLIYILRFIA